LNMAIFSTIKSILSAPKALDTALDVVEKGTDGIIAGFDRAFYTQEERAESLQARIDSFRDLTKLHIELMEKTGSENTVRSITRRKLAVMIIETYLFLLIASAIIYRFDSAWALHVIAVAVTLNNIVIAVAFFFFGGYVGTQLFGLKKETRNKEIAGSHAPSWDTGGRILDRSGEKVVGVLKK